jgi:hypothetical protein
MKKFYIFVVEFSQFVAFGHRLMDNWAFFTASMTIKQSAKIVAALIATEESAEKFNNFSFIAHAVNCDRKFLLRAVCL